MKLRNRPAYESSPLAGVAPFDRLAPDELRPLAANTDRVTVSEGTVLAREDRPAKEFIVVLSGEAIALRHGREVGRLDVGTQLGGPSLVEGVPNDVTVVATTEVEVLVVHGPAYRWAAKSLPPDAVASAA
jgi:CRP-like cAMP-binding protein